MYDVIIIGAGITGLSTAFQIKQKSPHLKVLILEKEDKIAQHQTGHNSGVIHSGIYYKPGSLKAKNCLQGYRQLIRFCKENEIAFDLCGKIIVATDEKERPALEKIYKRGQENGLAGIQKISKEGIKEHEPHCEGIAGIFVPQTGIVDYKKVAEKYLELFEQKGGAIRLAEKVTNLLIRNQQIIVETAKESFATKVLINCAGLYSDKIAKLQNKKADIQIIPFRGEYFRLKPEKEYLVRHLIYPVPDPQFPFLGVHFTRMINGGVEAGPNAVLAFAREGYTNKQIHSGELLETLRFSGFQKVAKKYWKEGWQEMRRSYSKKLFTKALQRLIPEIQMADLEKGNAGIRAQACDKNGNLIDDFLILENNNIINVCNAPSPAATASLSIGQYVAEKALKRF